jgi:hypothetical protein
LDEPQRLLCVEVHFSERSQVFELANSPDALRLWKAMKGYKASQGWLAGRLAIIGGYRGATVRPEGPAPFASCSVNGSTGAGHSPLRSLAREAKRWPESRAPGCVARRISRPVRQRGRGVRSL